MGNYKNDFKVTGSKSLLNAFTEELHSLGYTQSPYSNARLVDATGVSIYGWNGVGKNPSVYTFDLGESSMYKILSLPSDWDEALKLASEKKYEEYKVGDYIMWPASSTRQVYRVTAKNGNQFTATSLDGKISSSYDSPHFQSRIATPEEVKSTLIKFSPFKYSDKFKGLRNVAYGEILEHPKETSRSNYKTDGTIGSYYFYNSKTDTLYSAGFGVYVVYEKGVWATKLDALPKISGYEGKIENGKVIYGCQSFDALEVIQFAKLCEEFGVTYVALKTEGSQVTLKELKAIAEAAKQF